MRIEHIALWTRDVDRLRAFYERYFGATAGARYENQRKQFQSYFLCFEDGARLELMHSPRIGGADARDTAAANAPPAGCAPTVTR
jgi:lactoylglutathione lyase